MKSLTIQKGRIFKSISLLLVFAGILILLSGCEETSFSLEKSGDTFYQRGEKARALSHYQKALQLAPNDKRIRTKVEKISQELYQEDLVKLLAFILSMLFLTTGIWAGIRYLTPDSQGLSIGYRLRLATGQFNWSESEELKSDFYATRNLLIRKRVFSYLRPLSAIMHEFFLMRDSFIRSEKRLLELNHIIEKDIPRLQKIAEEMGDRQHTIDSPVDVRLYMKKTQQQRQQIQEFAAGFNDRKRQLLMLLIDLRTRINLNDNFDGINEIESLSRQIASIRKTFAAVDNSS